jgi:superfamily II DNA or RNA helicase
VTTLFEAVRRECSRTAWSRGVELARSGAVAGERDREEEIVLRVAGKGGLISPTVVLRPGEALWDCDCRSIEDPCEHVAASVIALRRAQGAGGGLPESRAVAGTLGYRLHRAGRTLRFERVVVAAEGEQPLTSTLAAVASGRVDGPSFAASEGDLAVERALGSRLRGALEPAAVRRLLAPLASCPDVRLDGRPVCTSMEPALPHARVEDSGDGFRVSVVPDPAITERLCDGVVLCGDVLRPLEASGLTGRELEDYSAGCTFPPEAVAELVTEVIPGLRERMPVEIRTQRLPATRSEPPRIALEVERRGDALSVLPTLVYGEPICARVDAGRLVHLRGAVPIRDLAAEASLLRRLRGELAMLPGQRRTVSGEEALGLAASLEDWEDAIQGSAHREFFRLPALEPSLHVAGDRFELEFRLEAEGQEAARKGFSAARVLQAWREGCSLLPVIGGGFAPLPHDWLERFGDRIADLLSAREGAAELPACLLPDLAHLCEELNVPAPPGFERLRALVEDFRALPAAPLPSDLRGELRSYQRRGVDWLVFHREAELGALLADDMGLGKTLQALCAITGRTLVVCPTSVMISWTEEIRRFRPGLRVSLFHGSGRALDPDANVTVTTYALLRAEGPRLAAECWDTIILDESQAIKNPDSQVARAAHGLRARFRVALTGTPVENRLEELWSQLHFLNPGLLGSRADFQVRYARPVLEGDARARARLRERIRPFVLRRLKAQVARELPPRTEVVLRCELTPEERRVYDAVRAAARRDVVERVGSGASLLEALEALLRLRQAACHPSLVPGQEAATSSKLELLLEALECAVAEGHRALVFSQWTKLLDLTEPLLREAGIRFTRLDGSTRDRAGVVESFQAAQGPPVLLISLRAGGSGLNLTAADHVFLLDPWWNPAVEDQAADRAHRIGQERPVEIHRLVARETVEERILSLQEHKRRLGEAALGGVDATGAITREELLALLE